MSVVLYEDEKFYKIYNTISMLPWRKELAHVWDYPEDWANNGMISELQSFVQLLRDGNTDAWNERYQEKEESNNLDFTPGVCYTLPYPTLFDLVKALKSISYNMVEAEGCDHTKQRLLEVIYFFMSRIIDEIPEYQNSKAW